MRWCFVVVVTQVTGANKGIGLAIVRGLCKLFDGDVLLTGKLRSKTARPYVFIYIYIWYVIFQYTFICTPTHKPSYVLRLCFYGSSTYVDWHIGTTSVCLSVRPSVCPSLCPLLCNVLVCLTSNARDTCTLGQSSYFGDFFSFFHWKSVLLLNI